MARVTGEDCFTVRRAFAEPEDIARVVDPLAAHGSETTSLVVSHPESKPPRLIQGTGG